MNNPEQTAFGQYGSKVATDSAATPDDGLVFVALTALTASTLTGTTAAEPNSSGVGAFTCPVDISIPQGVTVYGRWTKVETDDSANKLLCYQGK